MYITFKIFYEPFLSLISPSFSRMHRKLPESNALLWNNGPQTWAGIRITWQTCQNTDCWVPHPSSFIQRVWNETWECASVISSQVILMLQAQDHTLKTTSPDKERLLEKEGKTGNLRFRFTSLPVVQLCGVEFPSTWRRHRGVTTGSQSLSRPVVRIIYLLCWPLKRCRVKVSNKRKQNYGNKYHHF